MRCRRALSFRRAGSGLQARDGQSKLAALRVLSGELGPSSGTTVETGEVRGFRSQELVVG